ncbi:ROK family protein [Coprobacter tertius]|uniref:ROK family protein n=1 Tax=Coprobacter tertius TaxID=2944915 RepID=A0ABT1MED5_9BACT|nr:ROK family protein [Coprobacter tertius]MCP9610978.1 ROK family protein [Coprobacter tertius]
MIMRYAVGLDLGGTSLKYAVVNEQGVFLYSGEMPSLADISRDTVIDRLKAAISDCIGFAALQSIALCGVGVGTPGITDENNRIVLGGAENIAGWENIPLAGILEKETGIPTLVANDANAMGLGEQTFGAAKGCTDVLFITVGTGIGGAVIINNKLYGGYKNRGMEMGHIPLIANGERCACGSVGCLETYASTAALIRRFEGRCRKRKLHTGIKPDGKMIVELYHKGDSVAIESLNEHWDFLGHGIAGLVNIFSPQRVVIGGGISEAGGFYISRIGEKVKEYSLADCRVNTLVCAACLGNRAGMMGAASMIFSGNIRNDSEITENN